MGDGSGGGGKLRLKVHFTEGQITPTKEIIIDAAELDALRQRVSDLEAALERIRTGPEDGFFWVLVASGDFKLLLEWQINEINKVLPMQKPTQEQLAKAERLARMFTPE